MKIDTSLNAFDFVAAINKEQFKKIDCLGRDNHTNQSVLFNKDRYFELSMYDRKKLVSIQKAIKCKIEYDMICGPKSKLPALAKALNKRNIFLKINVDWI